MIPGPGSAPGHPRISARHPRALVRDQEVVHVVGVLFFLRQDLLEQHARRRVLVREVADHVAVGLDRDALGDEVLLDHVDEVLALDVLRGGARGDPVRVQVRLAAELVDALGEPEQVLLLLVRVLLELLP